MLLDSVVDLEEVGKPTPVKIYHKGMVAKDDRIDFMSLCSTGFWTATAIIINKDSLSQPQPQPHHSRSLNSIFNVCFSFAISLIKAIIDYCDWQCD